MLRNFVIACVVSTFVGHVCRAQSSGSNQQSQSSSASPTTPSAAASADAKNQTPENEPAKDKKKAKKIWTEDDISKVGGTISVVGDSSTSSADRGTSQAKGASLDNSAQGGQVAYYRDQVRQLQAQLDATDKKLDDLRNFKAENSSASGGINPNHGYSMTPIPDQIKQLEAKKKEIQDKLDATTDEARKKGIEPGQLR